MGRRTWLLGTVWLLAATAFASPSYSYLPPSPQASVLVRRPDLVWPVWGDDGLRVTGATLRLNGQPREAVYDAAERAVFARIGGSLLPGDYSVEAEVVFDGKYVARQAWTFSVSNMASESLEPPTLEALRMKAEVDGLRAELGLEPLVASDLLGAACEAHAGYMARNITTTHIQNPKAKGFAGATPLDRAGRFGYWKSVVEMVSGGLRDPAASVRAIFAAPYHRLGIMRPGRLEVGAAHRLAFGALLIGGEPAARTVVSPARGQQDVPTDWNGIETPNPLEGTGLKAPVGYPVVVGWFGEGGLALRSARLTGPDGHELPVVLLHPGNDSDSRDSVILVPHKPLAPGTTYTAKVEMTVGGRPSPLEWTFRTAEAG